jgi:hypothetical protein
MGGAGLDLYGGSQNGVIAGCLAADISGTAIQVGGILPCPACPLCAVCPDVITDAVDFNVSISDTVIVNATQEFGGCLGVWGGYMRRFSFVHNDVCRLQCKCCVNVLRTFCAGLTHSYAHALPDGGISLGWGWAISVDKTFQRENEIAYNQISHYLRTFQDSGGECHRAGGYVLCPQQLTAVATSCS